MMLRSKLPLIAATAALLALGACATPFRADVARFQAMPAPNGQSFVVQASDARKQGGLEFSQYAALVSQRLAQQGYRPANDARSADLVVNVDYGVDRGREKVVTRPGGFGGWGGGWGGGFGGGWGRGFGPGWGWGGRSAFYYGWNDPFYGPGWGYPDVSSYTLYTSFLDLTITRAGDNSRLFEGKARARSTSDSLPALVPNLVEAMFTGFPGNSGEEVKITVPPPPRRG